ncbi:MAG: Nif3-like dinuclear metal center hexameric protein [Cyclobacteriaceae bacterium]|nr:Nif3-like dinuclear metal center hexameric protein [Cyclobacteriaceae bacterium]
MKVADVTRYLETIAPRAYQESYDNAGLLTGQPDWDVTGILVTLDCLETVVEEAVAKNCNLIVAHHPIVFKGLKKLTGSNYVERTVIKAIQHNIAIYATHTNLDHVHRGVNRKIGEKLGLKNLRILSPRPGTLSKLVTFIPEADADRVMQALHEAGAGQIGNYKNCSFRLRGTGTFMPNEEANPHIGQALQQEYVDEVRAEVIFPTHLQDNILRTLRKSHPYEEVAYYINPVANDNQEVGAGMVGELEEPLDSVAFLRKVKQDMGLSVIRHTAPISKPVSRVAVCGGAGIFLLQDAIRAGAQAFITADVKYHEFFDADNRILLADIGHYESEVFTKDLLVTLLNEKFPTFAVNFSGTITNPVRYLTD